MILECGPPDSFDVISFAISKGHFYIRFFALIDLAMYQVSDDTPLWSILHVSSTQQAVLIKIGSI